MKIRSPRRLGFTLVELLVAAVIVILIMAVTLQITSNTASIWQRTRSRVDAFQDGRAAFEWMSRHLSQAMLNTYWDYADADGKPRDPSSATFNPKRYARQSDLHFISGSAIDLLKDVNGSDGSALKTSTQAVFFQAPLGLSSTGSDLTANHRLNVSGYFLEYGDDAKFRPRFLQATGNSVLRHRFRLMEMTQPTESVSVYRSVAQARQASSFDPLKLRRWFVDPLNDDAAATSGTIGTQRVKRVLAENIIALVLLPKRSIQDSAGKTTELAPRYAYDSQQYLSGPGNPVAELSRNQLPPMIQVTMVAIDETSAARLQDRSTDPEMPPDFGLEELFNTSGQGLQYATDLATLEQTLAAYTPKISYRVFTTNVSILQAKWSEK